MPDEDWQNFASAISALHPNDLKCIDDHCLFDYSCSTIPSTLH
jgi:hypothetical protein